MSGDPPHSKVCVCWFSSEVGIALDDPSAFTLEAVSTIRESEGLPGCPVHCVS